MSTLSGIQGRLRQRPRRTAVIGLSAVTVAVAAVLVYVLVLRGDSEASAQGVNEVEHRVQRGDITTSTSFGGTLRFAERKDMLFSGGGTVGEVMVAEGDTVRAGDVIAKLNASSTAALILKVTEAEEALREAQIAHDSALSGATELKDLVAAEKALAEAEAVVKTAEKKLRELEAEDGTDSFAVGAAKSALALAQMSYGLAVDELAASKQSTGLANAEEAATKAREAYRDTLYRWFGYSVPEELHATSPDAILAAWGVTLGELYGALAREQAKLSQPWMDNPETPWDEGVLWIWTSLLPGGIDTEALTAQETSSRSVRLPRAELQSSWDALQAAEKSLLTAQRTAANGVSAAEQALAKAETDLDAAEDALAKVLGSSEYRSRQVALDDARATRDQAAFAVSQVPAIGESKKMAAAAKLDIAKRDLENAESALANATLTAPFDGEIEAVNVAPGDTVSGTQVVVVVVNKSALAVEASVDEEDILSIFIGAPASVTLDAVAGRVFTGTVTSIGQAQQSQMGAVTFPVVITLDNVGSLALVEGLTAAAQVISSQTPNVLMVPVAAVGGTFLQPTVQKVTTSGARETAPVQTGASNGTFVEVVSGLSEGDTVIATYATGLGLNPDGSGQVLIPGGSGVTIMPFPGGSGGFQVAPGGGFNRPLPGTGGNRE